MNEARAVIFHCRSGARTSANASGLAAAAGACDAYILEGGLDAWKRAGLPVLTDRKQPLEIMRQVQITAGGLVLLGVVLGATVLPIFYGLAAIIGAGLMFSGISGTCAMASMLRRMPWNRVSQ
jgi:rhodanese-related sulfurtransferase